MAHAKGGPRSRVCACKNPELTPKYILVGVEVGVSEIFLGMQSYSFGKPGLYAKIGQPPKKFLEFTPKCIIVGVEGGVSRIFFRGAILFFW